MNDCRSRPDPPSRPPQGVLVSRYFAGRQTVGGVVLKLASRAAPTDQRAAAHAPVPTVMRKPSEPKARQPPGAGRPCARGRGGTLRVKSASAASASASDDLRSRPLPIVPPTGPEILRATPSHLPLLKLIAKEPKRAFSGEFYISTGPAYLRFIGAQGLSHPPA